MTVKILVTGDNHLDNPSIQYGAKKSLRKKDFKDNFAVIIESALENKVDLLLICGDLFHTTRPSNSTRAWVMHQFRRLANKGISVVVITGHHDTPKSIRSGVSPLRTHGESGHITYLENPSEPEPVDISINGTNVRIVGIGFNPLLDPDDDPLSVEIAPPDGDLNILMLHYPIVGFSGFMGDECKVQSDRLPKGYQLVVAGHFHSAQDKKIGNSLVVIPGSTERISFNEEGGEKSFSLVTFEKGKMPQLERVPLDCREMKTITIKVKDGDDINKIVEKELGKHADSDTILRITIEGLITAETLATYRRSPLQRMGDELCFKLLIKDTETLRVQGLREIEPVAAINPDDELLAYFDTLLKTADEEEQDVIKKAELKCREYLEEVVSE